MDVDVVERKRLARCDVKAAANPVNLQVSINLTALGEHPLLLLSQKLASTLFNCRRHKLPTFPDVLLFHLLACVAAFPVLRLCSVTAAAFYFLHLC